MGLSRKNGSAVGYSGPVFDFKSRTSGSFTANSTNWTNLDTGLDIVLAAQAGDVIEVGVNYQAENEASTFRLDVATIVSGAVVNYFGGATDPGSNYGVSGWTAPGGTPSSISGSVMRTLASGDISNGQVTLRLRYRTDSAANKTIHAQSARPFQFSAKKTNASAANTSGAGILGSSSYNPGVAVTPAAPQGAFGFVDSTNLTVTFVAPSSGIVIGVLTARCYSSTGDWVHWGVHNGTSDVTGSDAQCSPSNNRISHRFRVTGLTPGQSYTWKWRHYVEGTGAGSTVHGGSSGPAVMEVLAA